MNNIESLSRDAKCIANKFKHELGFVNLAALKESASKGTLYVEPSIGFVHYHIRKDAQTTIYSLAVLPEYQKQYWGRLLFYKVLTHSIEAGKDFIIAKCPTDLESNGFYSNLGFELAMIEKGKKRNLNVWKYTIFKPLLFYCADGGRNQYSQIAQRVGWRLGIQSQAQLLGVSSVEFVDNDWKNYDHNIHTSVVQTYKPLLSTIKDIETAADIEFVFSNYPQLTKYCGRLVIIPKIKCPIPEGCWVGYSVPTRYGKTEIEVDWFKEYYIHLLGGSPKNQAKYSKFLNVVSVDGNYAMKIAKYGKTTSQFGEFKIQDVTGEKGCYPAFEDSMFKQLLWWRNEFTRT